MKVTDCKFVYLLIIFFPNTLLAQAPITTGVLEEIRVNATRLPRSTADIAGTISVVTQQDIERELVTDFEDLVRYQPGISFTSDARGGNQGLTIRGIGGNRVLNLIDGIRSIDEYFSNGRDVFETDDFQSVEIIRGPASALYGADALGGVVLMKTKDPEDYLADGRDSHFGAKLFGDDTRDEQKIRLSAATQFGDVALMAQYTRRDFSEQEISSSVNLDPLDATSDNLLTKLVWDINDRHRLKLTFDAFQQDKDFDLDSQETGSVSAAFGRDEMERYRGSIDHHWQLDQTFADSLDSKIYMQKTDGLQNTLQQRTGYSFAFTPFGTDVTRVSDFEFNQEVWGADLMLVKHFGLANTAHSIVYGLTYEQLDTERPRHRCETSMATGEQTCDIVVYPFAPVESFPNKTFPDTESTRIGFYIQDEIGFGASGFTLIPALRYDIHDLDTDNSEVIDVSAFGGELKPLDEAEVSLNLGLIYDVSEVVSLFAQYAEGFRPPNYNDANLSFVNRAFRYATIPNAHLRPEDSWGLELGVKVHMDTFQMSFSLFENQYDDFIDSVNTGVINGIRVFQNSNIDEVEIYGAELSATWLISPRWRLRTSIAHARGTNEVTHRPINSIEPLTGVFGLAYNAPNDRWGVESTLTLVDEKDRVEDPLVDATNSGYGIVDLIGFYRFNETTKLRVGVFNLFDKTYARWSNLQGTAASDDAAIALAHAPGMQVRGSFELSF